LPGSRVSLTAAGEPVSLEESKEFIEVEAA
jgi:hypothetical protein